MRDALEHFSNCRNYILALLKKKSIAGQCMLRIMTENIPIYLKFSKKIKLSVDKLISLCFLII